MTEDQKMKYRYYVLTEYGDVFGTNSNDLADELSAESSNIVIDALAGEWMEVDDNTSDILEVSPPEDPEDLGFTRDDL